ncbi:hypothetical protein [Mycolicibacterium pulveris]|uniref:hypothetical protein n=1 Tax=Mycolicibacterium pulveris TaxID=36813 RepID=UPI003CF56AA1
MSSSQPPDPSSSPQDDYVDEPEFDDNDTGPVRAMPPAQDTWSRRFDAPLTVTPRPVQKRSVSKLVPIAAAAVVAVAAIGGLGFWLLQRSPESDPPAPEPTAAPPTPDPTTTSPEPTARPDDEARLMQMLPRGYPPGSCEAVDAPERVLAQVNCAENIDPDGPLTAVYTLVEDRAALDAAFHDAMRTATQVVCPGNIQSPGPWRRNASPDRVSGTLFCGLREGQPTVIWTDDERLLVSAVESGPQGPTFPQLYAWWSSHS